jgi:hypothetical protein
VGEVAGTLTLTKNPCTIAAGETTCQPTFDWTTTNTELGSAGRVAFNVINNAGTGTYANETSYADSNAASGTDGHGAPLEAGRYTIKLYGFKSNDWVELDSKIQTVLARPTNLTGSCSGTTINLSWTVSAGATGGRLRLDDLNTSAPFDCITLSPGETCVDTTSPWSSTSGIPGHSYHWWVHSYNAAGESVPAEGTFTCSASSPDLTVSGITPTSAVTGTATTFSATVTNTGGGSTGIGFKNFYQVKSGTAAYAPQNFFTKLLNIAHAAETITDLAATTMSALAAGGNGSATQTYTFPAAGIYGIRVCADKENSAGTNGNPNGLIAESDETNNCGGWTDVNVTSLCTPSCGSGSVCSSGACVSVGGPCTPTNACGQSNSGTYNSAGVCSVSAPAMPATYGNSCPSVPATNVCGMAGTGTIFCNGSCSATTPSDTPCLPTVTLSADPTRVRKNTSTKLTWTSSAATSCTLTGQNGFSSTALLGTAVDSTPLDAQTTFTLTCSNAYGSKSASVIVNLVPSYIEQ